MDTEWFGLARCIIVALTGLGGLIWIMAKVIDECELDALWVLGAFITSVPAVFCSVWAYDSVIGFIVGMAMYLVLGSAFLRQVWKLRTRPSEPTYKLFNRYR